MFVFFSIFVLLFQGSFRAVKSEAPPAETCAAPGNCQLKNAYGTFTDRLPCLMSEVRYPSNEQELVEAVAYASRNNMKMKAVSRFVHTIPKWVCAGGEKGMIISTKNYNQIVVNVEEKTATVDSGVQLRAFIDEIAKYNLAFPTSPYWDGVSMAGVMSTGSHGSSLVGKGGGVHEYARDITMVIADTEANGWAKVKKMEGDELEAAKISLGLLGVISKITFELQPMFKRSVTLRDSSDEDLEYKIVEFARSHTYADVNWHPALGIVIWREDDRVPVTTPGDGKYVMPIFNPTPDVFWAALRTSDNQVDSSRNSGYQCMMTQNIQIRTLTQDGGGLTNNDSTFTGFPVVGLHPNIQSSGGCQLADDTEQVLRANINGFNLLPDGVGEIRYHNRCPWDPRFDGFFFFETTVALPLEKLPDYIRDIKYLRNARPNGLCGMSLYGGFYFRFLKKSTALLGEPEDTVVIDTQYYRSSNRSLPRLNEDIYEEVEQIGLFKHGGRAHWGKNRDAAFSDVRLKYPNLNRFLNVRKKLDPRGLFSNEWSDRVFGLTNQTVEVFYENCALEGICRCRTHKHCNPTLGSYCRPGLVYPEARVCRFQSSTP